jgi:hypothetical protein
MSWEGLVASVGDRRGAYRFWWGGLIEREHLEDLAADGEDNIKIGLQQGRWGGMNWINISHRKHLQNEIPRIKTNQKRYTI